MGVLLTGWESFGRFVLGESTGHRPSLKSVNPHVTVLGTGGTIACTTDAAGDLVPTCSISTLLSHAGIAPEAVTARDVMQLDSSTMTLADLDALLVDIHSADGPVVLTHGTDSMEETAMAVDRLLGGPVVLTGAQRPADDVLRKGPTAPATCAMPSLRRPPPSPGRRPGR